MVEGTSISVTISGDGTFKLEDVPAGDLTLIFLQDLRLGPGLAARLGQTLQGVIDVQRAMRTIQRRALKANETIENETKKISMHAADGVHLNQLGHLAMAFAILMMAIGISVFQRVERTVIDTV